MFCNDKWKFRRRQQLNGDLSRTVMKLLANRYICLNEIGQNITRYIKIRVLYRSRQSLYAILSHEKNTWLLWTKPVENGSVAQWPPLLYKTYPNIHRKRQIKMIILSIVRFIYVVIMKYIYMYIYTYLSIFLFLFLVDLIPFTFKDYLLSSQLHSRVSTYNIQRWWTLLLYESVIRTFEQRGVSAYIHDYSCRYYWKNICFPP